MNTCTPSRPCIISAHSDLRLRFALLGWGAAVKGKVLCMYLLTMVQSDRQILRLLSRVNALPMAAAVCMLPKSFRGPQAVMVRQPRADSNTHGTTGARDRDAQCRAVPTLYVHKSRTLVPRWQAGLCAGVGLGIRELRVATAPQPDPLTQVFSHLPERRTYLC